MKGLSTLKVALLAILVVLGIAAVAFLLLSTKAPTEEKAPVKEKVLIIGTTNIVKTDNLLKDYYMGIFAAIFTHDTLAIVDQGGNIVPSLVNWSSKDAKEWKLTLIRNATWHDGKPVTAEDVAFTITYLKGKVPGYAIHLRLVRSVELVDDRTVLVKLDKEWASFPVVLAAIRLLPKHVWLKVDDPMTYSGEDRHIGCGPFKYGGFDPASGTMFFIANKNYWRGPPNVDKVVLKFYASTDAMLMALKRGDIAVTYTYAAGIDPAYVPSLLGEKGISFIVQPNFAVDNSLWFNYKRYPYNMSAFRKAISYALDYESYVTLIAAGYAKVPSAGWIPDSWYYYVKKPFLVKNVTLAKSMLDSLGFIDRDSDGWRDYPNGTPFTMKILVRSDIPLTIRLAELIKRDLEAVNIRTQLVPVDLSTFQTILEQTKDYDVAISRTTFWGMLTYAGAGTLYFDSRGVGWANVDDPSFHALVDEILRTSDPKRIRKLYETLQDFYADNMYAIPLYWGMIIQPYRSDMVDGFVYNPMLGILGRDTWYSVVVKA